MFSLALPFSMLCMSLVGCTVPTATAPGPTLNPPASSAIIMPSPSTPAKPPLPDRALSQVKPMANLTLANKGQTITVKSGDTIVLRLTENPTTGFRWSVPTSEPPIVTLKSDTYELAQTGIGGSGARTFTLQAGAPGKVSLKLRNWRDWEGEASVIDRYEVTLQIIP